MKVLDSWRKVYFKGLLINKKILEIVLDKYKNNDNSFLIQHNITSLTYYKINVMEDKLDYYGNNVLIINDLTYLKKISESVKKQFVKQDSSDFEESILGIKCRTNMNI